MNKEKHDFENESVDSMQNEVEALESRLQQIKSRMPARKNNSSYMMPGAIIIAGLLIGGAVVYSTYVKGPLTDGIKDTVNQGTSNIDIKNVNLDGEPFIGEENAPLTMAYWRDFQCPFCQRFELQTLDTLVNAYVKTGKMKIVFKDFQFLGPDSQTLGIASRAVWELYPEKHYEWQIAIFQNQGQENSGWATKDNVLAITRKVAGIDIIKVGELMDSKKDEYQKNMDVDKTEAAKFGINGTPGFVIGTQAIYGAVPLSEFTKVIDAELQK